MLSQEEIYNHLWQEVFLRQMIHALHPDTPENHIEIAQRKASVHAVQNTWYWFNNQEAFIKNAFYPIRKKV